MSPQDSLPNCLSQAPKRKVDVHRSPSLQVQPLGWKRDQGNDVEAKEHPKLKRSIRLSIINCSYGETEAWQRELTFQEWVITHHPCLAGSALSICLKKKTSYLGGRGHAVQSNMTTFLSLLKICQWLPVSQLSEHPNLFGPEALAYSSGSLWNVPFYCVYTLSFILLNSQVLRTPARLQGQKQISCKKNE